MATRTETQAKQYNNNKKVLLFNKKVDTTKRALVDDHVLKNADITDLTDATIDATIKVLQKVKSLNKQREKLHSDAVIFISTISDPLLKAPIKLNIEADEELYNTMKTLHNPKHKSTQMIKFKNESKTKFLLTMVKQHPNELFHHLRGEAQLAINQLYDDIDVQDFEMNTNDYVRLDKEEVAKRGKIEYHDEPDYEFEEDAEFEAKAKAKAGVKTRQRKHKSDDIEEDPEFKRIMKAKMKKEAEQTVPRETITWSGDYLIVPEFVENSKQRVLKKRYINTVEKINEMVDRIAEIEPDEYDKLESMEKIKVESMKILREFGEQLK